MISFGIQYSIFQWNTLIMPTFKENKTQLERKIFKIDERKSSKSYASKDISFPIHILRNLFSRLSQFRSKFKGRKKEKESRWNLTLNSEWGKSCQQLKSKSKEESNSYQLNRNRSRISNVTLLLHVI